jgi:hypothetical protein
MKANGEGMTAIVPYVAEDRTGLGVQMLKWTVAAQCLCRLVEPAPCRLGLTLEEPQSATVGRRDAIYPIALLGRQQPGSTLQQ